jgi:hypothetical protein
MAVHAVPIDICHNVQLEPVNDIVDINLVDYPTKISK